MVKNESDIIESVVTHLLNQDLDHILVVDNGSSDGTLEILRDLALKSPITVGLDTEVGYYQAEKMTELARRARIAGASWVLPFDADEFWFARGQSVGSFLKQSSFNMHEATIYNAFPTPEHDRITNLSGGLRFDSAPHALPKIAVKTSLTLSIGPGNHKALRYGWCDGGLFICHVPWRSREQVENKVRQGARAYSATDLDESLGAHWRDQDVKNSTALTETWRSLLRGQSDPSLGWNPKGPFLALSLDSWSTWDPGEQLRGHPSD